MAREVNQLIFVANKSSALTFGLTNFIFRTWKETLAVILDEITFILKRTFRTWRAR
jgi:hypothetical protein